VKFVSIPPEANYTLYIQSCINSR